ncbi:c-type cytochrome [Roseisalinus antarcticus]|uniref:Fructose dehydrogenase cytochrome subunit n=1 Tax=Roseisalinus antarcticus TaxID=254357 RepID=A0A1Y5T3N5_9RHOB|nr:c-type cytochrome [Roseisalinus antarcticus]SLN54987.1 Fructose dehydrogenase cytochrome subunit precursor [Roseisalinus antarcticus]
MKAIIIALSAGLAANLAIAEPNLDRGEYLVEGLAGCGNCHTPLGPQGADMDRNLAGRLVEDLPIFTAVAANITPAGRVGTWSDAELVRAIREGIRPDGTVIGPPMPIGLYRGLSDDDVMSIVMYLRTVPAVENDPGASVYNIPLPPAYGPPITTVSAPPQGVTVEYGGYLAGPVAHCLECHTTFGEIGPMMDTHLGAGGYEFHGPWGVSVAPNLTSHPEDGITDYSDAELKTMITTGMRGDVPMMPPMPYPYYANATEDDIDAIILFLRTLPALPDPE